MSEPILVSHRSGLPQTLANIERGLNSISPREWRIYRQDDTYLVRKTTEFYRRDESGNVRWCQPGEDVPTLDGSFHVFDNPYIDDRVFTNIGDLIRFVIPEKCFTENFDIPKLSAQVLGDMVCDYLTLHQNDHDAALTEINKSVNDWSDEEQLLLDQLTAKRERVLRGNRHLQVA